MTNPGDPVRGKKVRERGDRLALWSVIAFGLGMIAFFAAGGYVLVFGMIDQLTGADEPVGELSWDAARGPLLIAGTPWVSSAVLLAYAWIIELAARRDIDAWSQTLQSDHTI